jgi:hypothetical protein
MNTQFGAIELFSSTKATKKIESAVKSTSPMAIGETLKLFGGNSPRIHRDPTRLTFQLVACDYHDGPDGT